MVYSFSFSRQVAGQLVARLEGGESQVPALVAAPVLVAVITSDGGAALAAVANLDPLYLSDNPGTWGRRALAGYGGEPMIGL